VVVERREAEFLLDVLEEAFDFWFVAPAKAARRSGACNASVAYRAERKRRGDPPSLVRLEPPIAEDVLRAAGDSCARPLAGALPAYSSAVRVSS
jgi:hypothetical protein